MIDQALLEQQYYEMLTRTDHPVFRKDFSTAQTASSPFNAIMNRLYARQLVKLRLSLETLKRNRYPHTVDETGIDRWEETYFGFTKPWLDLDTRRQQLMKRYNSRIRMTVGDVKTLALAITGQDVSVIRNLKQGGWILGKSALGTDTIFGNSSSPDAVFKYVVIFPNQLSSDLKAKFDNELSRIEKAGSIHVLIAPKPHWILGVSVLGVDTILG